MPVRARALYLPSAGLGARTKSNRSSQPVWRARAAGACFSRRGGAGGWGGGGGVLLGGGACCQAAAPRDACLPPPATRRCTWCHCKRGRAKKTNARASNAAQANVSSMEWREGDGDRNTRATPPPRTPPHTRLTKTTTQAAAAGSRQRAVCLLGPNFLLFSVGKGMDCEQKIMSLCKNYDACAKTIGYIDRGRHALYR
jgi:hypothetical protein